MLELEQNKEIKTPVLTFPMNATISYAFLGSVFNIDLCVDARHQLTDLKTELTI